MPLASFQGLCRSAIIKEKPSASTKARVHRERHAQTVKSVDSMIEHNYTLLPPPIPISHNTRCEAASQIVQDVKPSERQHAVLADMRLLRPTPCHVSTLTDNTGGMGDNSRWTQ